MSKHPDILLVCDHGIRGGQLDEVVRYIWPDHSDPYTAYWGVPFVGPSGQVIETQLTGSQPGISRLTDLITNGPFRFHHEIICVQRGCTRLAYRSDVARLQTLFDAITNEQILQEVFTVSATESEITITIDALHEVRDTAKRKYGLRV
jgi:hypothetical protein